MKIIVLVKEVPDTYGPRVLDMSTGLTMRSASERVLDEIGERSIEAALKIAEDQPGSEVVLLSMGPDTVPVNLRKGLSIGADRAIHILDDALTGADARTTAKVLAAAARDEGFDLIVAGNISTDGYGGVVPAMIAEILQIPALTNLVALTAADGVVSGRRIVEYGTWALDAPLPAIVSVTEGMPDARFPSFTGIRAAKKKPLATVSAADLGVSIDGDEEAQSIMLAVAERPARTAGLRISDDGTAGEQLAEYLTNARLI